MSKLHPFLQLMRHYVIDYTNSHDTSWLPRIMTDDYIVNIGRRSLLRSGTYKLAVETLFDRAPGLGLTVHEFYCNGDRLAMRFSEHSAFLDQGGRLASWRGFSTYEWDKERLTICWVEQDFRSRALQLESGHPQPVSDVPGIDPWMTPIVPEDTNALSAGRKWLETFDLSSVDSVALDDSREDPNWQLEIIPQSVTINDVFSAGNKVPFHIQLSGPTRRDPGKEDTMNVCGVLTISANGKVERIEAVSDRMSVVV